LRTTVLKIGGCYILFLSFSGPRKEGLQGFARSFRGGISYQYNDNYFGKFAFVYVNSRFWFLAFMRFLRNIEKLFKRAI